MKFIIRSSQNIQEVQQDFRQIFSHLRPEFYQHQHADLAGNPKKEQYLHHVQMQELGVPAEGLSLELEENMRTSDFEQMMESSFGLHVQIFRLQKGTWLQTTSSDHLSLGEQNKRGVEADTFMPEDNEV